MWASEHMKQKHIAHRDESIQGELENILTVARDFLALVNEYGSIGCINHRAPSDKRFKLTRNGSYYELAGYTFSYGFMHDTDDIWWTFVDYDATCIFQGKRMTLGEAYFWFVRQEGIIFK